MTWRIALTPAAKAMLEALKDRRVREGTRERIDSLALEPEKQGKPLLGELTGYRSLRAVGQRFRIIYCLDNEQLLVLIVAVGIRKEGTRADIYSLARKLLRLRLFEPPRE